jgi:hypothetical protein
VSLGSSAATAGAGFLVGMARPTGVAGSDILFELVLIESASESTVCKFSSPFNFQNSSPASVSSARDQSPNDSDHVKKNTQLAKESVQKENIA